MYVASDPRSRLKQPGPAGSRPATDFGLPTYAKFYEREPQINKSDEKTWYARGESFLTAYTKADTGAVLARTGQVDEYALLLPDADSEVEVRWKSEAKTVKGKSVVFVPPGDSAIQLKRAGRLIRFFTARSKDLLALCSDEEQGYVPDPNVGEPEAWPLPEGGFRVRAYSLEVPQKPGRFGRIFRCTTIMINFLDVRNGRRDPTKMSPHSHDDFQQCSLCLEGSFVHHLRWPWTSDMTKWRDDQHELCGSPSVAFIPARVVHTSESVDPGVNQLVDIFCPPRLDFSTQDGWVLNADDYPMPTVSSAEN